jgi:hypothetical protein
MDFDELASLQRDIKSILEIQDLSLNHYYLNNTTGFSHVYEPGIEKKEFSKSSTATCVLSLFATGHWTTRQPWDNDGTKLFGQLLTSRNWKSAGLKKNNPFTVAFMLEAAMALGNIYYLNEKRKNKKRIRVGLKLLQKVILTKDHKDTFSEIGAAV